MVTEPSQLACDLAPKRIQRTRARGFRMPAGAVYVGRPTAWGNPYKVDRHCTAEQAVRYFRDNLLAPENERRLARFRRELAGRDLACWCPLDQPCHADVLLDLVNRAPAWALCSDCRMDGEPTCPAVPTCWAPLTLRSLPLDDPSAQAEGHLPQQAGGRPDA